MNFEVGQSASFSRTIKEADIIKFARLSGDYNPVHVDEDAAKNSKFGKKICHGALVNFYISTVLGMYMPGPGTIYIAQETNFVKPVYINDTVTAICEILSISDKRKAEIRTVIKNQDDEIVVCGKALVILPIE